MRERDGESEGLIYIERVLKLAIKWRKGVVRASEIGKEMQQTIMIDERT